jgi:hypothetical protein
LHKLPKKFWKSDYQVKSYKDFASQRNFRGKCIWFFTQTTITFLSCWIFKFPSSHRNYILSCTNYRKNFENRITKSKVIKILRVNLISVAGVYLFRYWTVRPMTVRPMDSSSNDNWSKDNSSNGTIRPKDNSSKRQFVQ